MLANQLGNSTDSISQYKDRVSKLTTDFELGLFFFLIRKSLFWIIPALGISLVSNELSMISLHFHYHDIAIVPLFVGSIYGLKNLKGILQERFSNFQGIFKVGILIVILLSNNISLTQRIISDWPTSESRSTVKEVKRFAKDALTKKGDYLSQDVFVPYLMNAPILKSLTKTISEKELKLKYKNLLLHTTIPNTSLLNESTFYGKPICLYKLKSEGSEAYIDLAVEIINKNQSVSL